MRVERVTTKAQLKDAYSVRSKVFIQEQNVPEEEEIDRYEAECIHFVVYEDAKPIGAARLRTVDEYGKVERVCILKEYRGAGTGKILMEKMEDFALENGIFLLKLNSQTHAENFYSKIGYVTYSDTFMDAGIPHVAMKKTLE